MARPRVAGEVPRQGPPRAAARHRRRAAGDPRRAGPPRGFSGGRRGPAGDPPACRGLAGTGRARRCFGREPRLVGGPPGAGWRNRAAAGAAADPGGARLPREPRPHLPGRADGGVPGREATRHGGPGSPAAGASPEQQPGLGGRRVRGRRELHLLAGWRVDRLHGADRTSVESAPDPQGVDAGWHAARRRGRLGPAVGRREPRLAVGRGSAGDDHGDATERRARPHGRAARAARRRIEGGRRRLLPLQRGAGGRSGPRPEEHVAGRLPNRSGPGGPWNRASERPRRGRRALAPPVERAPRLLSSRFPAGGAVRRREGASRRGARGRGRGPARGRVLVPGLLRPLARRHAGAPAGGRVRQPAPPGRPRRRRARSPGPETTCGSRERSASRATAAGWPRL